MNEAHAENTHVKIKRHPHVRRVESEMMNAAKQRFNARGCGLRPRLDHVIVHAVPPLRAYDARLVPAPWPTFRLPVWASAIFRSFEASSQRNSLGKATFCGKSGAAP